MILVATADGRSDRTGASAETFQYDVLGRLTGRTNDLGAFTLGYLGQTDRVTTCQLASRVAVEVECLRAAADFRGLRRSREISIVRLVDSYPT